LISDITVDPSIYFEPLKERIDSFVIVPIPYKSEDIEKANQAIGAICISEKISGGVFTHEDQDLLSILANQVGIALANAELYEQATVDSLTKVFVRRYFFQKLEKEIKRSRFYQSPLVLLMMDIDHFKKKNDTYGHQAGDYILQEVGRLLKENLRSGHVVARYGGEEFAVILCNTPKDVGRKIGERLRKSIESYSFVFEDQKIPTTISIGGALLEEDDDLERFIHKADTALYKAKETGRNKVVFA
ncbi:MAG: sensor domain-containing diguanylate cyclase, partial [Planctomycetota bacterium]